MFVMSKRLLCFGLLILVTFVIDNNKVFAYCHPQCLEYIQAITTIGGPYGNANGAWQNAPGNNGWRRVLVDSNELPHVGDVLYMNASDYGHVGSIESVDAINRTVEFSDRNWDGNCGFRSGVEISLDNSIVVGWLTLHPAPDLTKYRIISDSDNYNSVSIAWAPSDVPCDKASVWSYNETCSAEYSHPSTCQTAYDELVNIKPWKYNQSDWQTIFFGDIDDFQDLCY